MEYIIEIESFATVKEAREYGKKHIRKGDRQVNIVSRDITVEDL